MFIVSRYSVVSYQGNLQKGSCRILCKHDPEGAGLIIPQCDSNRHSQLVVNLDNIMQAFHALGFSDLIPALLVA